MDPKQANKYGINQEKLHASQFPQRSGNLETTLADPAKRRLMGQPENGMSGTNADKPGRESSIDGSSRETSSTPTNVRGSAKGPTRPVLTSMGQPHERAASLNARGGVSSAAGDDAGMSPIDQEGGGRIEGYGERKRSTTSPQLRNSSKPKGRPN